jgi:hypothetical protein
MKRIATLQSCDPSLFTNLMLHSCHILCQQSRFCLLWCNIMKMQSPLIPFMAIRGVTQQEIADALEIRRETVSRWMTGKTPARLTLEEWDKLAKLLGTSVDSLPRDFAPKPICIIDDVPVSA